jgi:hypothetical protein
MVSSKSIAERVDHGFHRRGNGFRRWRWRASLLALVAAMLLPAWAALDRNERLYEAGPVSEAHQLIANDCHRCHTASWKPAQRLARLDSDLVSVPDPSCTVCHAGPLHHQNEVPARTHCANCHREHRGHKELARVKDVYCTQCHASLQTTEGPSMNFARSIDGFAAHPEFAFLRSPDKLSPGPDHLVRQVAELIDGRWRDRARLRFNHKKHAGPGQLLRLDGSRQALSCEHCHQLDASSGTMRPIRHEQHCAECHGNQLHFDEQRFPGRKVTHGPTGNIRGELIDWYASLIEHEPDLAQDTSSAEPERERPGAAPLTETGWNWVNGRLDAALDQLLGRKQLGCRYCHTDVQLAGDGSWTVGDPQIPSRWWRHSVFRHDRHQLLTCTECHGDAVSSSATADILLPGIESCRTCHGSTNKRGSARGDCVECHVYHHGEPKPMDGPLSLELSPIKPAHARQPPKKAGDAAEMGEPP